MKKMTTSRKGLQLIKDFEGLRLGSYKCPAGVWTIGYGHTKGVKQGQVIDQMRADDYLVEDIAPIERQLNKLNLNFRQEQFDALVSWIFNLGGGNFNSSTMKKYIVGDYTDEQITDQMVKWVNAAGKPLVGLKKRRIAEANMFLGYDKYYLDEKNNIKKR
jgi:lysozyme